MVDISRYKVCVYAICKNEEQFVDRWMDAVREADMVIVLDTGSTDSTVARLRARGAIVYQQKIEPWRFDTARNAAMDHIPDDVDICVSNDVDEIFEPGWRNEIERCWTATTTRLQYRFVWDHKPDGSIEKESPMQKIHRRSGYRWVHPVHEILKATGTEPEVMSVTDGIVLHHYPDKSKPRSQYIPLLELSMEENPGNGQTILWLGREYMYNDRPDDAIRVLTRYLNLPNPEWDVERCAAMRFIAKCHQMKAAMHEAESWLFRAIAECPDTREPWYDMALLAYNRGEWALVLAMAERLLTITDEGRAGYLKENSGWGASPYDLASIAAYWLGSYQKSYDYASAALKMSPGDERIAGNLQLADEARHGHMRR